MNKKEFEEILSTGEGAKVEFKKTVSTSIGREMCAFANTAGGRIIIGIDDKNLVRGCTLSNQLKSRIQDIAGNCDPRVTIKIDRFKYDDKELVVVEVPESMDKPVLCSEGFFLREGANSQKMNRNEIFYWAQKTRKIRYEDQLREDFNYSEDFNEILFQDLMNQMNVTVTGQRTALLSNLGLGEEKKSFTINNAGIMLFGKKRDLYIRHVYVTCVLYKGIDKLKIIDRKDFRNGLVQDYHNAFKFLEQHLRLEYVIKGGGPRQEIPEIPYEALKEALLNAIIHRDYFEIGARVMVEIYDDRVEISNPGELLFEKEKIGKKSMSIARNPVLFDIFNRLRMVEKAGTGVQRILALTGERHLNVDFDIDSFFTVIFERPNLYLYRETRSGSNGIASPHRTYHASSMHAPRMDPPGSPHALEVLKFCLTPRKRSEIQQYLNLKNREHFRANVLNPLLNTGLLKPVIPGKPRSPLQKYVVTDKGKYFITD